MNVVLIRTNAVNPDPRVEKEVGSILKLDSVNVTILAWDRESSFDSVGYLSFGEKKAKIIRFGIVSEWGGGMKKNLIPTFRFIHKVKKWLKKHESEFDCIHACNLPAGLVSKRYLKNKTIIYDIYDFFADTSRAPSFILNYARKKEIEIINKANATIICSEQRVEQISGSHPKKLIIIHNSPVKNAIGNSAEGRKTIIKSSSKKTKIVYVGNLLNERFVSEMCELVSENDDIELHIGGVGVLSRYVESMGEKFNNITYYGKLQYGDVLSLERDCDIMMALYDPSIKNNTFAAPNKFYEALLLGKPLVMIKNTGMDSVVEKEKIGVSVSPNKEGILEGIRSLISIKNKWPEIAEKMKAIYDEKYSWTIMEKRLIDLYGSISK